MHEILGSITDAIPFNFFVLSCMYQYIQSTYQVQSRFVSVHTCKSFSIHSTNKYVLSWHQCCIRTYYAIVQDHLETTFHGTYHLVQLVTILRNSWLRNWRQIVDVCTYLVYVYAFVNCLQFRNHEFLRIMTSCTRWYVPWKVVSRWSCTIA
jgi:hypothetical protein